MTTTSYACTFIAFGFLYTVNDNCYMTLKMLSIFLGFHFFFKILIALIKFEDYTRNYYLAYTKIDYDKI